MSFIENKLEKTNLLNERPTQGTFGIHAAKVVSPGNPYHSVLLYRVSKTGRGRMPYLGSKLIDERGVAMLRDWIASLPADANPASGQTDEWIAQALEEGADGRRAAIRSLMSDTSSALKLSLMLTQHRNDKPLVEAVAGGSSSVGEPGSARSVRASVARIAPP